MSGSCYCAGRFALLIETEPATISLSRLYRIDRGMEIASMEAKISHGRKMGRRGMFYVWIIAEKNAVGGRDDRLIQIENV